MQIKTQLETLTELRNETLWKLLEAKATLRAQSKTAAEDPTLVVKEVMDPRSMQPRQVLIGEMVQKNTEAVRSWETQLWAIDEMLAEEEKKPKPPAGVEKP